MHCPSCFLHLFQPPSLPLISSIFLLIKSSFCFWILTSNLLSMSCRALLLISVHLLAGIRYTPNFYVIGHDPTLTDGNKRRFALGWQMGHCEVLRSHWVGFSGVQRWMISWRCETEWWGDLECWNRLQAESSISPNPCLFRSINSRVSVTFRNSKSYWCCAISLFPLSSVLSVSLTHTHMHTHIFLNMWGPLSSFSC